MADGVTLVEGANATPPAGTSYNADDTTSGLVPGVKILYSADGDDTPLEVDADGLKVKGTATLSGLTNDAASRTTVNDTATSTTLIASNADRVGWRIKNTSSAVLHISYGGTASATNCVASLSQNEFAGDGLGYTGDINGVWATDPNDGVAVCTEW